MQRSCLGSRLGKLMKHFVMQKTKGLNALVYKKNGDEESTERRFDQVKYTQHR